MSQITEQLNKIESPERPRSIPEKDLVRIWVVSLNDSPARLPQSAALEIAAWENRVRDKGWRPQLSQATTNNAVFYTGHAVPIEHALEKRVEMIVSAVNGLDQNVDSMMNAIQRMQSVLNSRIVTP